MLFRHAIIFRAAPMMPLFAAVSYVYFIVMLSFLRLLPPQSFSPVCRFLFIFAAAAFFIFYYAIILHN